MKFDIFNHVAISAGAGSGKTYTLSRRYVNILLGFNLFSETLSQEVDFDRLDPCPPDRIVTITYTEAGALEMRGRIFSLVQKIIAYSGGKLDGEDNDYKSIDKAMRRFSADEKAMGHIVATLQDAIRRLPESVISTIHSYCLHLIDSYGDYIGMDASPSVIADDEKNVIFDEVYKNETNNQSKLVEEIDETVSFYKLSDVARKFCFDAGFRRAFSRYADDLKNETIDLRNIWLAMLLEEHLKDIAEGLDASREMAQLDERKRDYYDALLGNFEAVLGGETEFQPYKGQLRTTKKLPKALLDRVRKAKSAIDALKDTAVNTPSETLYFDTLLQIAQLLKSVYAAFTEALRKEGYTDFETILEYADRLLEKDVPLDTRNFMVDEFQDTNDFQWGIITKAAKKTDANLFIVGDEKQSIFSFQGADVTVFGRAREQLSGSALTMTMNRRSDRAVIEMVNTVFSKVMRIEKDGQKAGHGYLPEQSDGRINALLERALETIDAAAVDEGYMTAYTPLKVDPDRKGAGNVELLLTPIDATDEACELECDESEQELRHIASYIKQAVETDIHPEVRDAFEKNKKAIAVLFDTRKQMLQLHRKLAELGIAAKVADSGNFYDTKEVNDIFILLKLLTMLPFEDAVALTPRQKYVLAGALRSNIIRMNGDGIDAALQGGELPEALRRWRMLSVTKNPAELIDAIVKESGVMHIYRQLENYAQREANVEQLIVMADDFAVRNGGELYVFVRELKRLIHDEMASEEEAFVIEEGVGSIEIRTIHSSKGLEWPMVILGSTQRSFMGMQPSESLVFDDFDGHAIVGFKVGDYKPLAYRFVKERTKRKHIEERKRLLYVAMTRPENILVISTVLTKTDKGIRLCGRCGENNYFSLINQSLDVGLEQLWAGDMEQIGDIMVRYPLPWEGKESPIENMPVCEAPKFKPLAFTDRRIVRPSGTPDVLRFLEPDAFDAASAGTAVHKIIEKCWRNLDDDACMKRWMDEFDVPEAWRGQIVKMARAFKRSPHYEKVMNGAEAYFEYDFTYLDENGHRVFGSIDLLYWDEEKESWVIVDFKTTALGDSTPEEVMKMHGYDRQLKLYAEFIEKVSGQKVASREICWLGALAKF